MRHILLWTRACSLQRCSYESREVAEGFELLHCSALLESLKSQELLKGFESDEAPGLA